MQWNAPPPLVTMPGVFGATISSLPPLELCTGGIATLGNLQGWTLLLCCLAAVELLPVFMGRSLPPVLSSKMYSAATFFNLWGGGEFIRLASFDDDACLGGGSFARASWCDCAVALAFF